MVVVKAWRNRCSTVKACNCKIQMTFAEIHLWESWNWHWLKHTKCQGFLVSLHIDTSIIDDNISNFSKLTSLNDLYLAIWQDAYPVDNCQLVEDAMPWCIVRLNKVESLTLLSAVLITWSTNIGQLSQLKGLELPCANLLRLLRFTSSLSYLHVESCWWMRIAMDLSNSGALWSWTKGEFPWPGSFEEVEVSCTRLL